MDHNVTGHMSRQYHLEVTGLEAQQPKPSLRWCGEIGPDSINSQPSLYINFNEEARSPFVRKHKTIIHPREACLIDTILKKFNVKCLPDHVDKHLRIMKTAWGIIAKLRNQSGCGWDENMRMIRMFPDVYNTYVEANPTHEKYLNKKIDMYDEMATVVGNDIA
ncbi:hypothetical protein Cgig2_002202 [Carnegiea gigantea]|uniref:Myb/SANT-like domain-containing protein n=1 Tax=Carnegiea gigantea TaxID=171969 RepID=A0A9Q1QAV6_9CARY|nr:hypothetical protein Cgig2_002202 [Carnegiea gigantea]